MNIVKSISIQSSTLVVTLTYNLSVAVKQVDVDALNGTILETI